MATAISIEDLSWASRGECQGLSEMFFGQLGEKPHIRQQREAAAIAICKTCTVVYKCRQFARENRELGIWGGETEDERYFGGFLNDPDVSRRNKARERRSKVAVF